MNRRKEAQREGWWAELAREWREAWASWRAEWRSWREALATAEGQMVALAVGGFFLFLFGLFVFGLDWDRLMATARHGGRCVQFLSGEKAAFFVVGTLTALITSVFFIAEAVHIYIHRRFLRRWWTRWLVGLGGVSALLWVAILLALEAWCF
ncbi:MAG: hypothetical protein N2557_05535 [Hydrogenophilus sp.]|nr:hypothetical protein [Hydrogenophilus sp.]